MHDTRYQHLGGVFRLVECPASYPSIAINPRLSARGACQGADAVHVRNQTPGPNDRFTIFPVLFPESLKRSSLDFVGDLRVQHRILGGRKGGVLSKRPVCMVAQDVSDFDSLSARLHVPIQCLHRKMLDIPLAAAKSLSV